jgi:hypothetical protein
MTLANELGLLSVVVADMQIDGRVGDAVRLGLLTENAVSDLGLCSVNSDEHRACGLGAILEHGCDGGLVVIVGNVGETFAVLDGCQTAALVGMQTIR